jgi:multiple sugar transport system permease protein
MNRRSPILPIVIVLIAIVSLLPFYFMVVTSFKTMEMYSANQLLPGWPVVLENYVWTVETVAIGKHFLNSVIVLVGTLIPYIAIATAAGFAFALLRFRFRTPLLILTTSIMIFPQMVLGVQLYALEARFGMLNTYHGLILAYLAYFGPYAAYLMTTYYRGIPRSYLEAATLDGATLFQIYHRIMLPVATPMLVTIVIVGSQAIWNELPFALMIMRTSDKRTLMGAIALLGGQYGLSITHYATVLTIAAGPVIAVYIAFQRRIRQGITAGGIKE